MSADNEVLVAEFRDVILVKHLFDSEGMFEYKTTDKGVVSWPNPELIYSYLKTDHKVFARGEMREAQVYAQELHDAQAIVEYGITYYSFPYNWEKVKNKYEKI